MKWFVAVLVVEIRVEGKSDEPLADLEYRLVQAADAESAYQAALQLGRRARVDYRNEDGERVSWRFVGLRDLAEVEGPTLAHGTEVYSTLVHQAAKRLVMPKKRLSVFWIEANKPKTARELLDDE